MQLSRLPWLASLVLRPLSHNTLLGGLNETANKAQQASCAGIRQWRPHITIVWVSQRRSHGKINAFRTTQQQCINILSPPLYLFLCVLFLFHFHFASGAPCSCRSDYRDVTASCCREKGVRHPSATESRGTHMGITWATVCLSHV